MTKICNKCRIEKNLEDFYREKGNSSDGRRGDCKKCKERVVEDWRQKNKDRVNTVARINQKKNRLRNRLYRYNLTPNQYHQMLKDQNDLCKICNSKTNDKTLVVDHCHKTGKTRALLCRKCNTLLSGLEADGWLGKALAYLKLFGTFAQ